MILLSFGPVVLLTSCPETISHEKLGTPVTVITSSRDASASKKIKGLSPEYVGCNASDLPQSSRRFPTHSIPPGNQLDNIIVFPGKILYFFSSIIVVKVDKNIIFSLSKISPIKMPMHNPFNCLKSGVSNLGQFLPLQED